MTVVSCSPGAGGRSEELISAAPLDVSGCNGSLAEGRKAGGERGVLYLQAPKALTFVMWNPRSLLPLHKLPLAGRPRSSVTRGGTTIPAAPQLAPTSWQPKSRSKRETQRACG